MFRYPIINLAISASCWYAVFVTLDRAAAIKNWSNCSVFIKIHIQEIIAGIFITSFIFHIPRYVEYVPDTEEIQKIIENPSLSGAKLSKLYQYNHYRIITFFLNSVVTTVIPLSVVVIFGIILVSNFKALHRSQFRLSPRLSRKNEEQISIATKLVLVYCILFITTELFSLFVIVFALINPLFIVRGKENPIHYIISEFSNFLIIFRASVSFLLYWMSCAQYRAHQRQLFSFTKPKRLSSLEEGRPNYKQDHRANDGTILVPLENLPLANGGCLSPTSTNGFPSDSIMISQIGLLAHNSAD